MAPHTPGPWEVDGQGRDVATIGKGFTSITAPLTNRFDRIADETRTADAALIAAAPDYHEAAVRLLAEHDKYAQDRNFTRCGCEWCNALRPVVVKAEGGAK